MSFVAPVSHSRNVAANNNLIFDIGMSEGNDTQFYLDKGFIVVGVEADLAMVDALRLRFQKHAAEGRLSILHRAAAHTTGESLIFYKNESEQGHSSLDISHSLGAKTTYKVNSINWPELYETYGAPYYMKIDIEGGEADFFRSMRDAALLPTYTSAECHSFKVIESLYQIGYRKFKLVNQTILHSFPRPKPPLEGLFVEPNWNHASGPFGRELPGEKWIDFQEIAVVFDLAKRLMHYPSAMAHAWFDCHATIA